MHKKRDYSLQKNWPVKFGGIFLLRLSEGYIKSGKKEKLIRNENFTRIPGLY